MQPFFALRRQLQALTLMTDTPCSSFAALGLPASICDTVRSLGYEEPSQIQAESIPHIIAGKDILGLAQTGTGKTAAFALPLISKIDLSHRKTQILVLAPTRELAQQVCEAFESYATGMKGFRSVTICGGKDMGGQLRALRQGVQLVVGTPGRVMDHLRRGTLDLKDLQALVLDEADEMLRMGFIDDVEWILEHTPKQRQIALFSATMPRAISNITHNYLNEPVEIRIQAKTTTVERIAQTYLIANGSQKFSALLPYLEHEEHDGIILFVRTKNATLELAQKLEAAGYSSAALNGDMNQRQREQTIEQLKNGKINLLIATDVAARGIDVPRVSHVINYDIPYDSEAYTHRIGRTGRAGRSGKALLMINNRERRLLQSIERATRQKMEQYQLPTAEELTKRRLNQFKTGLESALTHKDLEETKSLLGELCAEQELDWKDLAAAVTMMLHSDRPLIEKVDPSSKLGNQRGPNRNKDERPRNRKERPDIPMSTYRLKVGHEQHVKPSDILGAIANELDLESRFIGQIKIAENDSYVDLPADMPKELLAVFKKIRIRNNSAQPEQVASAPKGGDRQGFKKRRKPSGDNRGRRHTGGGRRNGDANGNTRSNGNRSNSEGRAPRKKSYRDD